MRLRFLLPAVLSVLATPSSSRPTDAVSPYVLAFAGDKDEKNSDFFAVIDVRPDSPTKGKVVATLPIGMASSMPHHLEYVLPEKGKLLFANAHHHEMTMLVDTSNALSPKLVKSMRPPAPLRFGHDFARVGNGKVLAGFLRSEGSSPASGDTLVPGNHGGLAEYSEDGKLLRTASAAVAGSEEPIHPYAIVPMLDIDRIVTTSAPMMEDFNADVVQVWRYSDLKLLRTIPVPHGKRADGSALPGAARYPFGPRLLSDGSILMNSYGCGFYRLTEVASSEPKLTNVYTIQVPEPEKPGGTRGACSIPVIKGHFWIMPVGRAHTVIVLDISDPARPKEASRLNFRQDFNPHWAALDPISDRVVLGAELGGEQGMYVLRFDQRKGVLTFDKRIGVAGGEPGYIDLEDQKWPHGDTGPAWAHAALFLPE
jgi:hypothetical protein